MLAELGRYQEAVAAYDQARHLGLDPSMTEAYYVKKGKALGGTGDVIEALKVIAEGMGIFPRNYDLFMLKGILLSSLGQTQLALEALDQAIQLNRFSAEGSYIKGEILRKAGQLEPALAAFEQAIKRQRGCVNAYVGKGIVLGTLGKHKEVWPLNTWDAIPKPWRPITRLFSTIRQKQTPITIRGCYWIRWAGQKKLWMCWTRRCP